LKEVSALANRAKYQRIFFTEEMERALDEVRAKMHMHDIVQECHEEALRVNRRAA
jgi:hypothetical protein